MHFKKIAVKFTSLCLVLGMVVSMSACGNGKSSSESSNSASSTSTVATEVSSSNEGSGEVDYSKFKDVTLKYWTQFSSTYIKSLAENLVFQELEKKTNIKVEFINPPVGQENESYNLLIASGDLPDIIDDEGRYPGGGSKAIADGVYVKLNDYIDKYAPNYKKAMSANESIARQTKEDDGSIWSFQMIQLDQEPAWAGPNIRQDYLDEVGLKAPTSIDEWHTVLTAFKDKLNVESPLQHYMDWGLESAGGGFLGTFGAAAGFMVKDGKIVYGSIGEGYKNYLTTMNQWYKEGLIDKDFATRDYPSIDADFTSGKAGANTVSAYGGYDKYIAGGKAINPNYDITPCLYPTLNTGDDQSTIHYRQTNDYVRGQNRAITTSCENIEAAVRWLDYAYSDEGFMLFNYGVEGQTYNWVDGAVDEAGGKTFFPEGLQSKIATQHPEFTELMTKNPDGVDFWTAVDKYKVHQGPYLRNPMAYVMSDKAIQAMETWSKAGSDYVLPPVTLTDEESKQKAEIMTQIDTYRREMIVAFIMGAEPLSNYEKYEEQIKKMGLDTMIKIYQDAYDRYINR